MISGYIKKHQEGKKKKKKKHQEENTDDLAILPVLELAIYMIQGESWVVLIPIAHYGSFEWKNTYIMSLSLIWNTTKLLLLIFRVLWDIYDLDTST